MSDNPLVTILLPTYNRTDMLINRSLPSAMNQTYQNLEIMVIGDGTEQATVDAIQNIEDPRVSFTNLQHSEYPKDPYHFWQVKGTFPLNWGIDNAHGEWLTMLGDDDEFLPHHVEVLLTEALRLNLDYVYGRFEVRRIDGSSSGYSFGSWPPYVGEMGNGIWRASLGYHYDTESWKKDLPCDWELVMRMGKGGAKFGFVPQVTYYYYPNAGEEHAF